MRHCTACGAERPGDVCRTCGVTSAPAKLSAEQAVAKFSELRRIVGRDLEREAERAAIQNEMTQ